MYAGSTGQSIKHGRKLQNALDTTQTTCVKSYAIEELKVSTTQCLIDGESLLRKRFKKRPAKTRFKCDIVYKSKETQENIKSLTIKKDHPLGGLFVWSRA